MQRRIIYNLLSRRNLLTEFGLVNTRFEYHSLARNHGHGLSLSLQWISVQVRLLARLAAALVIQLVVKGAVPSLGSSGVVLASDNSKNRLITIPGLTWRV